MALTAAGLLGTLSCWRLQNRNWQLLKLHTEGCFRPFTHGCWRNAARVSARPLVQYRAAHDSHHPEASELGDSGEVHLSRTSGKPFIATPVMAQPADVYGQPVCDDAAYKRASIIRSPTPGFDPLHWSSTQWQTYVADYVALGTAVTLALLALAVLLQCSLYIWRCVRCIYFSIRKPNLEAVSPYEQLTNSWLWGFKYISIVLGLGAIAMCVTGMVLLPRDVVNDGSATVSPAITYAGSLLSTVDTMVSDVRSISPIISSVLSEVNELVNVPALTSDLQCGLRLVNSVPPPAATAATLQELDAQLQTGTQRTAALLQSVQTVLALPPAVSTISSGAGVLRGIREQVREYSTAFAELPSFNPGRNSLPISTLTRAQTSIQSQQQAWISALASLATALQTVQAARDNQILTATANQAQELYDSARPSTQLRQQILPAATQALTALSQAVGLVSPALTCTTRFTTTMRQINATLVAFPPGSAATALAALSAAEPALRKLLTSIDLPSNSSLDRLLRALNDFPAVADNAPNPAEFVRSATNAENSLRLLPHTDLLLNPLTQAQNSLSDLFANISLLGTQLTAYMASGTTASYARVLQQARQAQAAADTAVALVSRAEEPASTAETIVPFVEPTIQEMLSPLTTEQRYLETLQLQLARYPNDTSSLLDTLNTLEPAWRDAMQLQETNDGVDAVIKWVTDMVNEALDTAASAQQQVQQGLDAFGSTAQLHDILEEAERWQITFEEEGSKYWNQYAWRGWLGAYALLIFLVLVTFVMVLATCPGGIVLALAACLLYLTLFLVAVLGVSGGLVVAQDACWASERIILAEVNPSSTRTLVGFYLYGHNSSQSLTSVLRQANIVDVVRVQASLNSTIRQVDWLTGNYTLGSSLQPSIARIQQTLTTVQSALSLLLVRAAHAPVHNLYISVKSFACCSTTNDAFVQWICMAVAALLVLFMAPVQFLVLGRLDALPRKNCFGFQCYRAAHYRTGAATAAADDSAPSSALDSFNVMMDMTRDHGDVSHHDQLSRPVQHSSQGLAGPVAKLEPAGPLSFHYFGPPSSPGQKQRSASLNPEAVARDTTQRDAAGRLGRGNSVAAPGLPAASAAMQPTPTGMNGGNTPATAGVDVPSAPPASRGSGAGSSSGTLLWYGEPVGATHSTSHTPSGASEGVAGTPFFRNHPPNA